MNIMLGLYCKRAFSNLLEGVNERRSIVVGAHASNAESLRLEPDSMTWLNARSLFNQQQIGTEWEHWGDKGGEERNWPASLTCRWLRISVLSNRHSPTYESIRDYLYFLEGVFLRNFSLAPLARVQFPFVSTNDAINLYLMQFTKFCVRLHGH